MSQRCIETASPSHGTPSRCRRPTGRPGAAWRRATAGAVVVATALLAADTLSLSRSALAGTSSPGVEAVSMAELEQAIARELSRVLPGLEPIEGQGPDQRVLGVRIDPEAGELVIDLSGDVLQAGHRHFGAELEDQLQMLLVTAHDMASPHLTVLAVGFEFEGQPALERLPD